MKKAGNEYLVRRFILSLLIYLHIFLSYSEPRLCKGFQLQFVISSQFPFVSCLFGHLLSL